MTVRSRTVWDVGRITGSFIKVPIIGSRNSSGASATISSSSFCFTSNALKKKKKVSYRSFLMSFFYIDHEIKTKQNSHIEKGKTVCRVAHFEYLWQHNTPYIFVYQYIMAFLLHENYVGPRFWLKYVKTKLILILLM